MILLISCYKLMAVVPCTTDTPWYLSVYNGICVCWPHILSFVLPSPLSATVSVFSMSMSLSPCFSHSLCYFLDSTYKHAMCSIFSVWLISCSTIFCRSIHACSASRSRIPSFMAGMIFRFGCVYNVWSANWRPWAAFVLLLCGLVQAGTIPDLCDGSAVPC